LATHDYLDTPFFDVVMLTYLAWWQGNFGLVTECRPEEASVAESLAGERGVKSPLEDGALGGGRDRISLRGR